MDQWKLAAVMGAVALGGVAVGGWLFGAQHARAQQAAFTQCFVARQESVDTNGEGLIAQPRQSETVHVPPGWTVVGGGGLVGNWTSTIVLCR